MVTDPEIFWLMVSGLFENRSLDPSSLYPVSLSKKGPWYIGCCATVQSPRSSFEAQLIEWISVMRNIPNRCLSGLKTGNRDMSSLCGKQDLGGGLGGADFFLGPTVVKVLKWLFNFSFHSDIYVETVLGPNGRLAVSQSHGCRAPKSRDKTDK